MFKTKRISEYRDFVSSNILPKIIFSVFITVIITTSSAFTDNTINATGSPPSPVCPLGEQNGRTIIGLGDYLLSNKAPFNRSYGVAIPAGIYDITFVSYDDHNNKPNQVQPQESWFSKLKNSFGDIVAVTPAISDLASDEEWLTETVATNFKISEGIFTFNVWHAAYPSSNPNSITPVCAAFDFVKEIPQCSDGIDNDDDGFIDYPDDFGCETEEDDDENEAPVITLLGDNPTNINVGDNFTDPGAEANDPEDGDITANIIIGGDTINTSTADVYIITYNVSDSLGKAAQEKTRTIEVLAVKEEEEDNGGGGNGGGNGGGGGGASASSGGGGGGGGSITYLKIFNEKIAPFATSTAVVTWNTNLPASSKVVYSRSPHVSSTLPFSEYELTTEKIATYEKTGHSMTISGLTLGVPYYFRPISGRPGTEEVGGVELTIILPEIAIEPLAPVAPSVPKAPQLPLTPTAPKPCDYLLEYIKFGKDNNPDEVYKLQKFLRDYEGFSDLAITKVYNKASFDAVSAFQKKYIDDVLTPWGINQPTGYVYITTKKKINEIYCQKEFPLSSAQKEEIEKMKGFIEKAKQEGELEKVEKITPEIGEVQEKEIEITEIAPLDISTTTLAIEDLEKPESIVSSEEKDRGILSAAISFAVGNKFLPFLLIVLLLLILVLAIALVLCLRKRRERILEELKTPSLGRINSVPPGFGRDELRSRQALDETSSSLENR